VSCGSSRRAYTPGLMKKLIVIAVLLALAAFAVKKLQDA
jgi:hypothetical protein